MNKFTYCITLLIALVLPIRSIQLHSVNYAPLNYIEIGDTLSNKVGELWHSHLNSFIDIVSTKVVNKLEDDLSNGNNLEKFMILLETSFDASAYEGKNLALIQTEFIRKLKDKFKNSKFGKKLKKLGSKAKEKLLSLYYKHKGKLRHFFSILLKSLVIPIAVQFIRKNLNKWKQRTLEATQKLDEQSKNIAQPIINRLYNSFEDKIEEYSQENKINVDDELNALGQLDKDKQDIQKLEEQEKALLQ
ncbi:hypothetical protein PFMG_04901 [Plasmodium falciparum IGH-CR14]|uniref:Gamete egress and sporozoite traversal protein n=1 Tax=Plasmodium falciparum IGH-CR14 TaxID=580059 RepID=A0A0L1IHU7_PLAFA|nr:hypothetical protein PFMG_04901 [Plasmodium falciparum IGH-CR14]